jgi:hypothetical protein
MTPTSFLAVLSIAIASIGFATAWNLWSGETVETNTVYCGTLRNPANPPQPLQALDPGDPVGRIGADLAVHKCEAARTWVKQAYRIALGTGLLGLVAAVGAVTVGMRERAWRQNEERRQAPHPSRGLGGLGLPGVAQSASQTAVVEFRRRHPALTGANDPPKPTEAR